MAQFFPTGKILSETVRHDFKYELAEELGLTGQIKNGYWGNLSSRDCGRVGGKIGGNMVKVMVKRAETLLAQQDSLNPH
ncbi:MAG: alpha/beta-type small acid-soluble spore protein [Heliobacteriaceae bacterium]|nr:alpha/beta-type small acid-soluble spore protein [Heliobacteriaceae bacterium]MDD4586790.1 alpha/beta-type small acid-soluble spore protein [Heliobacteriaceae bacterium]